MRKKLFAFAAMLVMAGVCFAEVDPIHKKEFRNFGLGRKRVTRIVATESVTTANLIPYTNGSVNVGNVAFTNGMTVTGGGTFTGTVQGQDLQAQDTLNVQSNAVIGGAASITGAVTMSSSAVVVDGVTSTNGVLVGVNSNRVMRTSGNNVFQQVGFGTNGQLVTFLEPFAGTPTALMVSPYGNWGLMITNGMGWSTLNATNFTLVTPSGVHTGHWIAVGTE